MLGPTASGKSEVGLRLAEDLGAELVSVDSMQVYRRMDIGTAKPTPEDQARVPHHGIDLVEPAETFTVADFQRIIRALLEAASGPMVVVGGSGLHFRALVDPMRFRPHDTDVRSALEQLTATEAVERLVASDPAAGEHVDLSNPRRVIRALEIMEMTGETPSSRGASREFRDLEHYRPLFPFKAVAFDPGLGLAARVSRRLAAMLDRGLVDEVAALATELSRTARQAVGYKELLPVVAGEIALAEGVEATRQATMVLAKHQRTYFRRDPRLNWLPWSDDPNERYRSAVAALRS